MHTVTPTQLAMCLLHGDYHVMNGDCWDANLDWQLAHAHLADGAARDAYQEAVERQMLDSLMRSL